MHGCLGFKPSSKIFLMIAFCNTFDLHYAKIGLENLFFDFLRVAVLHRFYCLPNSVFCQPQNSESRNNAENFYPCVYEQ